MLRSGYASKLNACMANDTETAKYKTPTAIQMVYERCVRA